MLQFAVVLVEELGDAISHGPPGFFAVGDKVVQGILQEDIIGQGNVIEVPQLVQGAKVNGRVPDPGAYSDDVIPCKEDPERDVLYGEVRLGRNGQPGNTGRIIC